MSGAAKRLVGENLCVRLEPFTAAVKDGRHTMEIKNLPIGFVPNLWQKVEDMLSLNDDNERG